MTLPKLAIKGNTIETQLLFSIAQENKLPYICTASATKSESMVTYYNQVRVEFGSKEEKMVLGADNIVTKEDVTEYYKFGLPRSAFTFLSYKDLFDKRWTSLMVYKTLPLVNVSTHKYELLKLLQSLRTMYTDKINEISVVRANGLQSVSYVITGKVGELNFSIYLGPNAISDETWNFASAESAIEIRPELYEYDELKIFSDTANPYRSFHKATYNLSPNLIWSEIEKSSTSLENLHAEDWEILNHV